MFAPGETRYARRSVARQESNDAFYDCIEFDALYRERSDSDTQAICCRDALKLGQTVFRQYEEIIALRHANYRLYRCLQQPGRFLVLPTQYATTRHAPGRSSAYRPCAILYSVIDAEDATNNRVVFETSLQPDIQPFELLALTEALAAYATSTVLEYTTEVMSDGGYTWTVGGALLEPTVIELGDSIRVAIDVDIAGCLLMQNMLSHSGIQGSVDITFGDGTKLRSTPVLDLNHIIGPWQKGPVLVTVTGGNALFTNQIEQSVTVIELHRSVSGTKVETVAVNTTLSAGQ